MLPYYLICDMTFLQSSSHLRVFDVLYEFIVVSSSAVRSTCKLHALS